jgi:hypothetical protein
MEGIKDDHLVI